jgi:serine/threonine protein phosphatase PrpC
MQKLATFSWLGSQEPFLDRPTTTELNGVTIGRYGGCTRAGAHKNEDGALVWSDPQQGWVFATLLDAHAGSDSAAAVLTLITTIQKDLVKDLSLPPGRAFSSLQNRLVKAFGSPVFLEECRSLGGETACLICAQKGKHLWWFGVGDCVIYLFHPELAKLGQFALNQRQFFEWLGRVNTFNSPVPSFTTGTRELRGGLNHIVMLTDGLLEFGDHPFENPQALTSVVLQGETQPEQAVQELLEKVHQAQGRDSATILHWAYDNTEPVAYPSG